MTTVTAADIRPILRRSFAIACVVGPILTLINQWEAVSALHVPDMTKVALTFLVPFFVSLFSGYSARKSFAKQMCEANALVAELRAEIRAHDMGTETQQP